MNKKMLILCSNIVIAIAIYFGEM